MNASFATTKTGGDLAQSTVEVIRRLVDSGVSCLSVTLRHAAREYGPPERDHQMGLTDAGRAASVAFGAALPPGLLLRCFSSPVQRCVETVSLIAEGYRSVGGATQENRVLRELGGTYVRDGRKVLEGAYSMGSAPYIREWLAGRVPETVLDDAGAAAGRIMDAVASELVQGPDRHLDVCVSHDWSIYLIKAFGLGLDPAGFGAIGYLEGVVLYGKGSDLSLISHEAGPVPFGPSGPRTPAGTQST